MPLTRVTGFDAVKNLQIPDGTIDACAYETAPRLKYLKKKPINGLPPRTVVHAILHPADHSSINILVYLPEPATWNGRFVGVGNVGAAGSINPLPLARLASQGYAAAATDLGTAPNPDSGIGNPEVWMDFGFRATHVMTITAKLIIQAFYGKCPDYSYFSGVSTGGQQAFAEVQRYPDDYDGVIAAAPAFNRTALHTYFLWNWQILTQTPFSSSQETAVNSAALEYLTAEEPSFSQNRFLNGSTQPGIEDTEAIIRRALRREPSLTSHHADALRRLFAGPRNPRTGEQIYPGLPPAAPFLKYCQGNLYLFQWIFGKNCKLKSLDFDADYQTFSQRLAPFLNATNADIRPFANRGGKLIIFAGTTDACVPHYETLRYYQETTTFFDSPESARNSCQLVLLPGKGHDTEGPGISYLPEDKLDKLILWRENGIQPKHWSLT